MESIAAFEELGVSETDGLENGMLAAVTKDGEVSIFSSPFHFVKVKDAKSLKEERKQLTRKPIATLKVTRPDKSSVALQIVSASFQGDELVIAVAESVTNVSFERVPWRDEHGGLRLEGESVIMKARIDGHESTINGVKDMGKVQIDESQTIIENGGHVDDNVMAIDPPQPEVIDISSGEEESSEESEGDDEAEEAIAPKLTNGIQHDDAEMEETSQGNADTEMVEAEAEAEPVEEEEPTFGDLLRQKNDGLIDVSATFHPDGPDHNLIPYDSSRPLEIPSGLSMGTVLAQSLRTNDTALLESCFRVEDLKIVRATIERLDSSLATVLLTKLAEKLHSRPGRAGTLMVWVQWTMVAHGGYLASRPDVVSKLKALNRVIAERASSLGPLLRLKGKLDMLEAQMHLRKNVQRQEKGYGAEIEDMEGITYIEGQEESSSEDEVEDNAVDATLNLPPNTFKPSSDDDEEMEDFNDFESEYEEGSESNLDDSESDREKRFIDDEASSTDNENSEEEEVNYDDKDSVSGFDTDSSDGDSEIGIDLERVVNGVKRKR